MAWGRLCELPHPQTQPTQARPSKGTQIVFAKQPPQRFKDRPQHSICHIEFSLRLTTMSTKLTQAFLFRMAELVLEPAPSEILVSREFSRFFFYFHFSFSISSHLSFTFNSRKRVKGIYFSLFTSRKK